MTCESNQAARLLEQSFLGDLDAAGLRELHQHLTACAECRAVYERQVAVERRLEPGDPPLPAAHLDVIGQAVLAQVMAAEPKAEPSRPSWLHWIVAVPALAALALVAYVVRPVDDGFQARSGASRSVEGLRAFCIGLDGGSSRILASAALGEAPLRCGTADSLQFSYTTGEEPLHLAIASVPDGVDGPVLQYTAGDATLPVAARALDQPLPYSTRLAARHAPGKRLLLALFFDQAKTASEIEEAARAISRGAKPAGLRLSLRSTLTVE